jgi:hypothetical protein
MRIKNPTQSAVNIIFSCIILLLSFAIFLLVSWRIFITGLDNSFDRREQNVCYSALDPKLGDPAWRKRCQCFYSGQPINCIYGR